MCPASGQLGKGGGTERSGRGPALQDTMAWLWRQGWLVGIITAVPPSHIACPVGSSSPAALSLGPPLRSLSPARFNPGWLLLPSGSLERSWIHLAMV